MERMRLGVLGFLALVAVLAFLLAPPTGLLAREPLMILCAVLAIIWHLAVSGRPTVPATTVPHSSEAPDVPSGSVVSAALGQPLVPRAGSPTERDEERPEPDESLHRPGYFDLTGAAPALAADEADEADPAAALRPMPPLPLVEPATGSSTVDDGEGEADASDLDARPVVAQLWPPEGVDVPRVFLEVDDAAELVHDDPPDAVIDLRSATGSGAEGPDAEGPDVAGSVRDSASETVPVPVRVPGSEALVGMGSGETKDPWLAFAAAMFRDTSD